MPYFAQNLIVFYRKVAVNGNCVVFQIAEREVQKDTDLLTWPRSWNCFDYKDKLNMIVGFNNIFRWYMDIFSREETNARGLKGVRDLVNRDTKTTESKGMS